MSKKCTLILTEGDSAKAFAVSGISVVGRDTYGVFPLRGKVLNVREATPKQILENKEFSDLKKIIGLQQNMKYKESNMEELRYQRIMIATDQDEDGIHILEVGLRPGEKMYEELLISDSHTKTNNQKIFKANE